MIFSLVVPVNRNASWQANAVKMKRLNRSIVYISVVFVSTFFVAVVVGILVNIIKPPPLISSYILYENGLLAYLNFSINGIIYGWRSGDYRREYKKLIGMDAASVVPTAIAAHNSNNNSAVVSVSHK